MSILVRALEEWTTCCCMHSMVGLQQILRHSSNLKVR